MDGNAHSLPEFAALSPLPPAVAPVRDVRFAADVGDAPVAFTPSVGARATAGLAALAAFAVGGLCVGWVLVSMNAPPPTPVPRAEGRAVAIAPPPPKPKPKPQRTPPPPQRPARATPRASAPPPPPVGGALAGLGYAMPGVGGAQAFGAADRATAGAVDARAAVMTESAVDAPPRATERRAPVFPRRARAIGQEGKVVLSVLIDESGRVEQVRVLDADPPGVFDEAATEAVRAWRFEPARYQGQKVRVWARQTLRFRLG